MLTRQHSLLLCCILCYHNAIFVAKLGASIMTNKGISDNGHFIQCLTSLIINSTSIDLTDQCIDFYRQAFNDEKHETRVRLFQCINQLFQCTTIAIRIRLASLIIPLFINFLPDSTISLQKVNYLNARLISYIIDRIQYLIPIYSNEFRIILQTLPDLRTKLENAIRRQQQLKQLQQQQKDEKESNYLSKHYNSSMNTSSQVPSLPLRIDFSNFKSS
ncbi:unnamed protein product [Rotaria sp. Silwood2]|nr:unnamed protein product [Rotaria sp. Silwood2]